MKQGDITTQDEALLLPKSFIGTVNRDVTIASGTQAVTGIGFRPTSIHFLYNITGTASTGWGFSDKASSGNASLRDDQLETVDSYQSSGTTAIRILTGVGDEYDGDVISYDINGFTFDWVKIGSPTGNLNIRFIAYK